MLLTTIWNDPSEATAGANFPALTAYVTIALIMPLCFLKDMSKIGMNSFLSLLPLIFMFGFEVGTKRAFVLFLIKSLTSFSYLLFGNKRRSSFRF